MPDDQPSDCSLTSEEQTQRMVLSLVVRPDQRPWSVEEIIRVLGGKSSRLAIEDALSELRNYGLLNQSDQMVFASHAAAHIDRLGMFSI
jgi:hypothetical protein